MALGAAPEEEAVSPEAALPPLEGDIAELVLQADEHYWAAQECLQVGDWTCYGQEMEALQQALEALVTATGGQ